jgi:hypothetical protein
MDNPMEDVYPPCHVQRNKYLDAEIRNPPGSLDLMVLKVLDALGIARRIEHVSEQVLQLNEGTVYLSLAAPAAGRETENWKRIARVIGCLLRLEGQE